MAKQVWKRPGEWRCWSCKEWVSNIELSNADGFVLTATKKLTRKTRHTPMLTDQKEPTNDQINHNQRASGKN